ncbi:hypothetical protein NQK81_00995 [Amycolatopsis roodepoortensis]|uniref:hypothetical protein n=1 Tax=Amycolatopsis roodepoortensis TaxID=700274 RepID=UPI00214C8731|nr:hypothetical protein [Amycolatopsis roodepoortensis]UUV32053.1 hypothetical protein NQK81_00995 [Amycolatopsis roodepoortensis]
MKPRTGLALALAATAAFLIACSGDAPGPSPPPTTGWVNPAPADRPGPQIVVDGTATWRTDHIGCAEMVTDHGQKLRLVGQVATDHERAVFEGAPAQERVRITGYTFDPLANATVCGSGIPFVAEKVESRPIR